MYADFFILWHIIYSFWICTYFYTDAILQRLVALAYKLIPLCFNKRLLDHENFGILFIASVDVFILDHLKE